MKEIDINTIERLKKIITESSKFVIVCHKNPDGDAIGSSMGLYHYLKNENKDVSVVTPNDIPKFLLWIEDTDKIIQINANRKGAIEKFESADVIFCLDFNSISRISAIEEEFKSFKATKVLIDHHPFPEQFADLIISDTSCSSTAELVYHVLKAVDNSLEITCSLAESLYTGISTDTGGFSFNSSDPSTFYAVSDLLKSGLDKDFIHDKIYNNYSYDRMRLLGYCLEKKMQYLPEYRTAFMSISKKELEEFNFQIGDTEGFVNYPLSIKGIIFSALFIEKDNLVKASFRSKGSFPANQFSSENFNGGGHLNAAGGESRITYEETIEKFKSLLPKYKNLLLKD